MSILDEIVEYKKSEVTHKKEQLPLSKILSGIDKLPQTRDFSSAVGSSGKLHLIAEIKKSSPSAGEITKNFDVKNIAKQYEQAAADAISVLTDIKYFQGDILYIDIVKQTTSLPVLRKDFIIDEYQIYESRYFGADAILLIAAVLDKEKIQSFLKIASGLKLSVITEVHKEEELETALETEAGIIGINNRNLSDLSVDINTTLKLRPKIPAGKVIISESGIKNKNDIEKLRNCGVNAVLIGEHFMKSENIKESIAELFNN